LAQTDLLLAGVFKFVGHHFIWKFIGEGLIVTKRLRWACHHRRAWVLYYWI